MRVGAVLSSPVTGMNDSRDTLYTRPMAEPAAFTFDDEVARVFPDMIRRSVPGYASIIVMTEILAGRYATEGSNLYDLGCSLGASTLAMSRGLKGRDCIIHGVDNSSPMIDRCATLIAADGDHGAVQLHQMDLMECHITNASMVVLNFSLQFIEPSRRESLLERIYRGLNPGGILLLSEKIVFADPSVNRLQRELHEEFKRSQGYSEMEISGKRLALENVLIPETLQQHRQRLGKAGFSRSDQWFQCCNFVSLIAFK